MNTESSMGIRKRDSHSDRILRNVVFLLVGEKIIRIISNGYLPMNRCDEVRFL